MRQILGEPNVESIEDLNSKANAIAEDILLTYARIRKFQESIKSNEEYLQKKLLEFVQIRHKIGTAE